MSNREREEHPLATEWDAFARRHPGHPFLEFDSLYAMSEPLIEAIRAEVPTFFSAEQEAFERDLVRTTRFGFFHGRALGEAERERRPDPDTGLSLQDRYEHSRRRLQELLIEEMRREGVAEPDIA